jgi:NADPH:quinone reductase-like Zn-dependent oxidoreductase
VLRLDDVARPGIGDEDVLVQVVAAGVDRGALHFMTGRPYLMRLGTGLRTPKVTAPGVSIAGRVEAVESQVARFAAGDGAARGTYAEYVASPQRKVAAKPPRLSFEEAAVLVSGCSSVPAFCRTASSVLRSLQPGRAGLPGTGLGLTIVKRVVGRNGGNISIDSQYGGARPSR